MKYANRIGGDKVAISTVILLAIAGLVLLIPMLVFNLGVAGVSASTIYAILSAVIFWLLLGIPILSMLLYMLCSYGTRTHRNSFILFSVLCLLGQVLCTFLAQGYLTTYIVTDEVHSPILAAASEALLLLPVSSVITLLLKLPGWIVQVVCALPAGCFVVSLFCEDYSELKLCFCLAYILYCAAYFVAAPGILSYRTCVDGKDK